MLHVVLDLPGEVEKGSVHCGGKGGGEMTLWGCSRLDLIYGSQAFLIVFVAIQVLFEQLIVTD